VLPAVNRLAGHPATTQEDAPMNRLTRLAITALVLSLAATPSWGGPPNPTPSDVNGNTAGGFEALLDLTSGTYNTAFGFEALIFNTDGDGNTAVGAFSLFKNLTGNFNSAMGDIALFNNSTGSFNVAVGGLAAAANVTGNGNVAIGSSALTSSTGSQNTAIGNLAGSALVTGNRNIYVGHPGVASESKVMRLGNGQTKAFIAGVAATPINGLFVRIAPNGQLGVQTSSARYKRNIEPMGTSSDAISKLRPVTYVYKDDEQGTRQYGLIAEEVVTVYPELITRTESGEIQGVRYEELIPMLLNELQRQHRELEKQRRELAELRGLIGQPRAVVAER
jgi:hypothetical protein